MSGYDAVSRMHKLIHTCTFKPTHVNARMHALLYQLEHFFIVDMSSEEDASIEEHKTLIEQLKECPEDLLFFIADNIAEFVDLLSFITSIRVQ